MKWDILYKHLSKESKSGYIDNRLSRLQGKESYWRQSIPQEDTGIVESMDQKAEL